MVNMKNIKLVATDLDGTFLKNDRSISPGNLEALHLLGSRNIIRVVATGRNMLKVLEVIQREVPFDYIVYSSGAGIYNWNEQKHIFKRNMRKDSANKLTDHFINKDYNFYAFEPAPHNHNLWYHRGKDECCEFNLYLALHSSHARPLPEKGRVDREMCQFMLIIPENDTTFAELKTEIESICSGIRVIRASSPVTKGYIWVEVFHRNVSKADGVKFICNMLCISHEHTLSIGNDYNDIDLLDFTACSYITGNAPSEIKDRYSSAPSNEEDAFASAVRSLLG